eukprot:scaffold157929_cov32-Tisochrysis_lutea.AAC.1
MPRAPVAKRKRELAASEALSFTKSSTRIGRLSARDEVKIQTWHDRRGQNSDLAATSAPPSLANLVPAAF